MCRRTGRPVVGWSARGWRVTVEDRDRLAASNNARYSLGRAFSSAMRTGFIVIGHFRNDARLTVTQRTTGAVAEGRTCIICEGIGVRQQWEVHAATQGKETFEEGAGTAVAVARTTARGVTDDAHQWLVPITLVEE